MSDLRRLMGLDEEPAPERLSGQQGAAPASTADTPPTQEERLLRAVMDLPQDAPSHSTKNGDAR